MDKMSQLHVCLFVFLTLHGFYYFLVFRSKSRWNWPSNIFGELLDIITISQSLQLFSRKSGGWRWNRVNQHDFCFTWCGWPVQWSNVEAEVHNYWQGGKHSNTFAQQYLEICIFVSLWYDFAHSIEHHRANGRIIHMCSCEKIVF